MKLHYITLNTAEEARQIGRVLLERQLAVCVNWFPITCAYRWQSEIVEEAEIVLIVKTQPQYGEAIAEVVRQHVSYTHFMAELSPDWVNQSFLDWLSAEVPVRSSLRQSLNVSNGLS